MVRHQKGEEKEAKCLGSGVYRCVLLRIFFFFFCTAVSVARWEQEQCLSEINTTHGVSRGREGGIKGDGVDKHYFERRESKSERKLRQIRKIRE